MDSSLKLQIYMPEKKVLDKQVHRVVLPCINGMLTVIEDRAPTLLPLDIGIVKILDENNESVEEYFIAGGAADVKENTCTVLTEAALLKKDMNLQKAQDLYQEFNNYFYEWLVKYFEKGANKK